MLTIEYTTGLGAAAQQEMILQAVNNAIPPPADLGAQLDYFEEFSRFLLIIYKEPDESQRCEIRLNPAFANDEAGKQQAQAFVGPLLLALFHSRQGGQVSVVEIEVNAGGGTEIILTAR